MRVGFSVRALILLLLLGGACSDAEKAGGPNVIVGVVVGIDARGLGDVRSFTLREKGTQREISVTGATDFAFAPGHLQEHRATAQPVRVTIERRGGELVALTVDDG